jgi:O-antigen/teichoic acid export membrane protein
VKSGQLYHSIIKSSAIYSIALVAPVAASVVMLPVYTRFLSTDEYGVIEVLQTTGTLFGLLLGGRFGDALLYYYAQAEGAESKNRVASTAMLGSLLLSISVAIAAWFLAPLVSQVVFKTPRWANGVWLILLAFALSLPAEVGSAWLRARNQSTAFVAVSLGRLLTSIGVAIVLVAVKRLGVQGVLLTGVVTATPVAVGMVGWCLAVCAYHFDPSLFRKLVVFALPLGATGVALFIIHSGDRFFLLRYVPLSDVGLYALAYKMGMMISLVQGAFSSYWFANVYHVAQGEDGMRRFARVNTYQLLVLAYAGMLITVFSVPAIHAFATPRYFACLVYVPWITAAYVIRGEADFCRSVFFLEGKVALDARLNWIAATFCLIAYFLLIPKWGLWGAILATGLTFILLLWLSWHQGMRLRPHTAERGRLLRISLVAVLLAALVMKIEPAAPWAQWGVGLLAALSFPPLLALTGFFRPEEKEYASRLLGRLVGSHT